MNVISVQETDFSVQTEIDLLRSQSKQIGAIATFSGLVRDVNEGDSINTLFLEHYPGMTEKSLEDIAAQACMRWPLIGVRIIHRVGLLKPMDNIVFVGVSSEHRGDALAACAFIMDYLKTSAPFWKKEQTVEGERWVDAKVSDEVEKGKWGS